MTGSLSSEVHTALGCCSRVGKLVFKIWCGWGLKELHHWGWVLRISFCISLVNLSSAKRKSKFYLSLKEIPKEQKSPKVDSWSQIVYHGHWIKNGWSLILLFGLMLSGGAPVLSSPYSNCQPHKRWWRGIAYEVMREFLSPVWSWVFTRIGKTVSRIGNPKAVLVRARGSSIITIFNLGAKCIFLQQQEHLGFIWHKSYS